MDKKRIDVISLGCSKNLVDSERLLKQLELSGFQAFHNSDNVDGDIVIINTCGFIGDAKEESINTILTYAEAKNEGRIKELYVMGCLSERYRDDLLAEIPEIDRIYGKFDWVNIVSDIIKRNPATMPYDRVITTPSHYTYLKIAEGCNRFCAFCAIPLITGRYKSRPIEEILEEVRRLVGKGVKEFNVIAQDLSSYGLDIYKRLALPELIDRMAEIDGVKWIRLHYAYPSEFPYEILDVMARHSNVCNYLDIALQHINNDVLKNMRRHITKEETLALIRTIREKVPGIHIRTTLMVGFPGETEDAFNELKEFVREAKFERMGAFAYCEEDDTYAAKNFSDSIPQEVKESRLEEIMTIQEDVALESNQSKIGKTMTVVIDREEPDYFVGRTEFDSPEVDPEVLIDKDDRLTVGNFYDVEITDALPFELMARLKDF
ncbi:ribosomal protein S12 methylthiotransferase RimO [Prevotella sp. CAG:279]|jgi:ribosomal protein S12 methylthiotransferase|uniref:30S ribosomal protein S12 methylthiotransferase RimO n=1 Tax=Candidatus Limisoma sp. TaxID=3076476 RepID=UPI00033A2612|nr:ribosomal protein S12 methylthiotransferase RimO [Prevotella sp. CAG:279]